MSPEERFERMQSMMDKQNAGIRDLVTDEKLNILIDTVDRIIRGDNDHIN
jgi:hypothetical protein